MSLLMSRNTYFNADRVMPEGFPGPVRFRNEKRLQTPLALLTDSEVQLLYWLMKEVYSGQGEIVELGTWLGGSTVAMAAGLKANPDAVNKEIHVYDLFIWEKHYNTYYGLDYPFQQGDCYLDLYRQNVQPHVSVLNIHKGDVCNLGWTSRPIEILFIDIMKTAATAKCVTANFFPYLIPETSFIVHQDFKVWNTFWIHLLMFRLRQYFLPVLNVGDAGTTVFKLMRAIPKDAIFQACSFETCTRVELQAAFNYSMTVIEGSQASLTNALIKAYELSIQYYNDINQIHCEPTDGGATCDDSGNHEVIMQPIYLNAINELISNRIEKVLIYGAGILGREVYRQAMSAGIQTAAFLESTPRSDRPGPNGSACLTPEQALAEYADVDVLIASRAFTNPMLHRLIGSGLLGERKIWII